MMKYRKIESGRRFGRLICEAVVMDGGFGDVAKIVFQKKQYLLGIYDNLTDAAEARKEAEEALNDRVTAFYDRWQEKAKADREWADENPISISVVRRNGELHVELLPRMQ